MREILEKELDWIIVVRLDPADFRGRQRSTYVRFFFCEKLGDRGFVAQVELRAIAQQKIAKTIRLQPAHDRAADQSAMSGDENFVALIHGCRTAV